MTAQFTGLNGGNRLLASLGPADLALLSPHLKDSQLKQGMVLQQAGDPTERVYFPNSGMISLLAVMEAGNGVETATIGREGAVGVMAGLVGRSSATGRAVVQLEGVFAHIDPSRQALWPSAQAIQLLPTPVGPVIKSPSARSIQSPATSFWNRARSMPRGVRRSTSSTTAFCRSAANLRRVAKAFGVALGRLAIDHQADPLLEREGGDVGRSALVLEGLGHSGQAEGDQTFMRWMGKHRVSFLVSGSSRGRGCWRDGRARGPNARPHQGKRDRGRS